MWFVFYFEPRAVQKISPGAVIASAVCTDNSHTMDQLVVSGVLAASVGVAVVGAKGVLILVCRFMSHRTPPDTVQR